MWWWALGHQKQVAFQLSNRTEQDLQQEHLFALLKESNVWALVETGASVVACNDTNALAWLHTHPLRSFEPLVPSALDMQVMASSSVPHGIVNYCTNQDPFTPTWWHDSIQAVNLKERMYRWGEFGSDGKGDCYALIRDWFRTNKAVELPSYPRDFYDKEGLYYTLGFAGAAEVVPLSDLQVGDIPVLRIGKQGEHAGVYTGNGLWLHHPINGVSREEPLSRYVPHIRYVLRVIL